jgi:folate-dependent phosphoribosylglycinamide formyltransferase PurN
MKNIVILISGRGSNMEAMLDAKLPCRIAAVISNKADAGLNRRARHYDRGGGACRACLARVVRCRAGCRDRPPRA